MAWRLVITCLPQNAHAVLLERCAQRTQYLFNRTFQFPRLSEMRNLRGPYLLRQQRTMRRPQVGDWPPDGSGKGDQLICGKGTIDQVFPPRNVSVRGKTLSPRTRSPDTKTHKLRKISNVLAVGWLSDPSIVAPTSRTLPSKPDWSGATDAHRP